MHISSIDISRFNIPLTNPFSYHTLTLVYLPYALCKITTDDGIFGYGEAGLAWDVTGETQKGAEGIKIYVTDILSGKEITSKDSINDLMEEISDNIFGNTALKCSIESALFDILGKKDQKPIHSYFSTTTQKHISLVATLSFEDQKTNALKKIKRYLEEGATHIKLKVGGAADTEHATISSIIEQFPTLQLILDANQAWSSVAKAQDYISKLPKQNIAWLEQPFKAQQFHHFAELKKVCPIPLMADESCHTLHDLRLLHDINAIDLVNIKLAKTGGILEAERMVQFAKEHHIRFVLGDMIHSAIGTAYNLHAATLDGFEAFDLTLKGRIEETYARGLEYRGMSLVIPHKSGLGISINTEIIPT